MFNPFRKQIIYPNESLNDEMIRLFGYPVYEEHKKLYKDSRLPIHAPDKEVNQSCNSSEDLCTNSTLVVENNGVYYTKNDLSTSENLLGESLSSPDINVSASSTFSSSQWSNSSIGSNFYSLSPINHWNEKENFACSTPLRNSSQQIPSSYESNKENDGSIKGPKKRLFSQVISENRPESSWQPLPHNPVSLSKNARKKLKLCKFCLKNGELEENYSNHQLRNSNGIVVCPILRRFVCKLCGATGDNAHTRKYCPLYAFETTTILSIARTDNRSNAS